MSISNDVDAQILDAARSCIEEFGIKRTTLAEVARRAGVSRPTVYRRWRDTGTLIADLLTREVLDLIPLDTAGNVDGATGSDIPARERLVATVVDGCASLRAHPLFDKMFRTDSDLLLTYIVERLGRSQRTLISHLATLIGAGLRDGSIRPGDPQEMATMVLLIAQSAVQSARMVAAQLPAERLQQELARALDGYLRPTPEEQGPR